MGQYSGIYTTRQQMQSIAASTWPTGAAYVTSNLLVYLDAGESASYPGTGTTWSDLSGNGNHFNIVATAYNSTGPKYMDFNGSYGMAKNASDISLSDSTGVTYVLATRVKTSTADWRTLTRSYVGDHQVIIYTGGNDVGYYDSDGSGFTSAGFYDTTFPNYGTTSWMLMYVRWKSTTPYMEISWNDTPGTIRGFSNSSGARYSRGFGSIGGYHANSTTPSSGSQYWGDIGFFMAYNRRLTDAELTQNYNYFRSRFSL